MRSSFSSCSILIASRRASWRSRISRMSSAWTGLSVKRAMSAAFGSSAARMMRITSSILSRTSARPSSTWMRWRTLSRRCRVRRSTVATRKPIHSTRIWRRLFWVGRPSAPTIVRLIGAELSNPVWASSVVIRSDCSIRLVLGSKTRRTGASLSDSSRTASSTASTVVRCACCSLLSTFLPAFTFGLVSASISSSTCCVLVPGGSSVTTSCHWPRASSSIFQRARTLRLPRPPAYAARMSSALLMIWPPPG